MQAVHTSGQYGMEIEALHRAHYMPLARAHATYCDLVALALATRGISLVDYRVGHTDTARTFSGWLSPRTVRAVAEEARLTWTETDGWQLSGIASTAESHDAPLEALAEPEDVADWASELLDGRTPGQPVPVTARRAPTSLADAAPEDLRFERRLAGYRERYRSQVPLFRPEPVPPPSVPRAGHRWDQRLRHRCLRCDRGQPDTVLPGWGRQAATHTGRVLFTRHVAVSGWCRLCEPEVSGQYTADAKLVDHHQRGLYPGSVMAPRGEWHLCPCCLDPWPAVPTTTAPLTLGVLETLGLVIHPCPWCWAQQSEEAVHAAQEQALAYRWTRSPSDLGRPA